MLQRVPNVLLFFACKHLSSGTPLQDQGYSLSTDTLTDTHTHREQPLEPTVLNEKTRVQIGAPLFASLAVIIDEIRRSCNFNLRLLEWGRIRCRSRVLQTRSK